MLWYLVCDHLCCALDSRLPAHSSYYSLSYIRAWLPCKHWSKVAESKFWSHYIENICMSKVQYAHDKLPTISMFWLQTNSDLFPCHLTYRTHLCVLYISSNNENEPPASEWSLPCSSIHSNVNVIDLMIAIARKNRRKPRNHRNWPRKNREEVRERKGRL